MSRKLAPSTIGVKLGQPGRSSQAAEASTRTPTLPAA